MKKMKNLVYIMPLLILLAMPFASASFQYASQTGGGITNNYYNNTYLGSSYNSTYDSWAYNQTADANLFTTDYFYNAYVTYNDGWLATYNSTYQIWAYNMTSPFSDWLGTFGYDYNQTYSGSTYNSTYDAKVTDDASWNKTYADTLYSAITWAYNMTDPFTDWLSTFNSNPFDQTLNKTSDVVFNSINVTGNVTIVNAIVETINFTGDFFAHDNGFIFNSTTNNLNIIGNLSSNWLFGKLDITNLQNFLYNYNQTYSGSTYNSTYQIWAYNQTLESTTWHYNMTTPAITEIANNNASWSQTYNSTYHTWAYNMTTSGSSSTYNSTYDSRTDFQMSSNSGKIYGWATFLGAGATLTPYGLAAFTATGTPAAAPSPLGFTTKERLVKIPSAATINTGAGYVSTALTEGKFEYLPRLVTKIASDDLAKGNRTIFVALTNATILKLNGTESGAASARPSYIGVRYHDVNATTDTTWQCCSADSTVGTCNSITNANFKYNDTWVIDVGYDTSAQIHCTVKNSTNTYTATKTTNLPVSTYNFGIYDQMTTNTAAARNFYIEWIYLEMGA